MKMYNIIWFDDEYHSLEIIKEQATINGINHVGFTNAAEGIIELEENYKKYDAVIIDGLFYNKPGQSGDTKTDKALADVFRALDRLKDKKVIPSFILSGQKSFTQVTNPYADLFKNNKVYDKQNETDRVELWRDIKAEADLLDDTGIRHQYSDVFNSCDSLGINSDYQHYIITILKSIKYNSGIDEMLYFAQLRKIIEMLFRKAEKYGLLHPSCIKNGEVNLSESSLFLSGHSTKYNAVVCRKSHFPNLIAESVKNIIFITGAALHTEDEEVKRAKIGVEDLRRTNKTPFLLYSLVFQLMDIIIWFKKYADANQDKELNKSLWQTIGNLSVNWEAGIVINLNAAKGFAFFKPDNGVSNTIIPPAIVSENKLADNDNISVIIEQYEDARSKEIKSRVSHLKRLG